MSYLRVQMLEVINGKLQPIEHPVNKEEVEEIVMSTKQVPVVKFGVGMTVNLGEYRSARVEVGIEMPVTDKTVDEIYDEVSSYCYDRLLDEVKVISALKKVK